MRPLRFCALGLLFLLGGCASSSTSAKFQQRLGPARGVLYDCLDAMGGLDRWESMGPITATALVKTYDPAGQATVNQQRQVLDLRHGVIRASIYRPEGTWTTTVVERGFGFTDRFGRPSGEGLRLDWCLAKTLRSVRGPLNLCGYGGQRPGQPRRVRISGMELIRIPAVPDGRGGAGEIAYYFDAQTCLLKLVTAGADAPGGEGMVTVYTYQTLPNGLTFPLQIRVVKIGPNVLIGEQPLLEVEYQDVKF